MLFQGLPFGIIALAMLAGLACAFYVPYKRSRSSMTMLWMVGWVIVVLRSILAHLQTGQVHMHAPFFHLLSGICIATASIIFLWSFSSPTQCRPLRMPWVVVLMLVVVTYCAFATLWLQHSTLHVISLLALIALAVYTSLRWLITAGDMPKPILLPVVFISAALAVLDVTRGDYFGPIYLLQGACNLSTAIFLVRRYRALPAAILTAASFLLWSGIPYVFFFSPEPGLQTYIIRGYLDSVSLIALIAAVGMLMLLLEEEVQINVRGRERERRVRQELEAYAQLDLHMMPGSDPRLAAERVCHLAAEHSIFQQAMIFLRDVKQSFYVAASDGMDADLLRALDALGQRITEARLRDFQRDLSRQRVSPHSARVNLRALFLPGDPLEQLNFVSAVSINLRSQTGVVMGSLLLGARKPHNADEDLRPDDLLPLETLVAKLAIAIENAMLTQRLLRSEKLAGLGQLAGGVAHELNNPLTVVMGYSELMSDATDMAEMREQAGIIHKESLRMKEIVESLVRFWRPTPNNSQQINLTQMLRDIYRLRSPDLERQGIHLEMAVPPVLPEISGNPDQLKQVFLQLLNNAVEAISSVDNAERAATAQAGGLPTPAHKIRVDASFDEAKLHILFSDTGPGFRDPHRVFDPFFTTKQPGEGTGLGLSICYGIVREHQGEINAFNLHPFGAAVVVDLPLRAGLLQTELFTEPEDHDATDRAPQDHDESLTS